MPNQLIEKVEEKRKVLRKLEEVLSEAQVSRARRDHHARRAPRPCGMTIHSGTGCSYGCAYCYVPYMGFSMRPAGYPLEPLEIVYALAANPYVAPGPVGTLAAYGSVTEPFLPGIAERTLGYLAAVWSFLKLPSQVSTKSVLTREQIKRLRLAEERVSVLVTVVTLRNCKLLEPGAPPPEERFATIGNMAREGLHVVLFLRPIIPGVTDREIEDIVRRAAEHGALGVVPGALRVTPGILTRLRSAGFDVREILRRLQAPLSGRETQVPVRLGDLKRKVLEAARQYGIRAYPSACAANVEAHGQACYSCDYGPCGDLRRLPKVSSADVEEFLDHLGVSSFAEVGDHEVVIEVKGDTRAGRTVKHAAQLIRDVTRRRVRVLLRNRIRPGSSHR